MLYNIRKPFIKGTSIRHSQRLHKYETFSEAFQKAPKISPFDPTGQFVLGP